MAITPKDSFDAALERADHLITIYEIVHDTRTRGGRKDWLDKFKNIMHWPQGEQLVRIDGEGTNSVLILRETLGIDRSQFQHQYVSELLRAALVAGISAVDKYFHDVVTQHALPLLKQKLEDIPKNLAQYPIPAIDAYRALQKLREDAKARPGHIMKLAIQENLHKQTIQSPSEISTVTKRMLGVTDFWDKVVTELNDGTSAREIQNRLNKIVRRRNQIVHEADQIRQIKPQNPKVREIKLSDTKDEIDWLRKFGNAIDRVFEAELGG